MDSICHMNAVVNTEFVVTESNGFLPLHDPLCVLPDEFSHLEQLM